jgi:exonuclease III
MKYLIYPILVYLMYLYNLKTQKIIHYKINIGTIYNHKLRFLTYNIQRLPYFFREKINISELLKKYDIICFQEDFCPEININELDFNIIHIGTDSHLKLVDSGLSIYSRIPLKFINFITFSNLGSVDKLSDKGFLVVKYNDLYIINTHLQASYNLDDDGSNIAKKQFKTIIKYLNKNKIKKFIIMGDFNLELNKLNTKSLQKLIPNKPTHYTEMSHVLNKTSAYPQDGFLGLKIDGAVYNNIILTNSKTVSHDKYTDHLGVSFYLKN